MLKYWFRLVTLPQNRLVSQCYWSLRNNEKTQDVWLNSIKNILDSAGFSHIWNDQKSLQQLGPRAISHLTTSILNSLDCQFTQNANSETNEQNKLHLFRYATHSFKPAPYLSAISSRKERSLFSKLRLGILQLEIETGRHTKPITESSKRFCKLCNSNKIGNECHFLFECPALEATRKPLLENILNTHRHLIYLSNEEKTKYLFFNNQLGNPTLLSASTLLWELFVARTALLKEV